jgi:hypothetical protein
MSYPLSGPTGSVSKTASLPRIRKHAWPNQVISAIFADLLDTTFDC